MEALLARLVGECQPASHLQAQLDVRWRGLAEESQCHGRQDIRHDWRRRLGDDAVGPFAHRAHELLGLVSYVLESDSPILNQHADVEQLLGEQSGILIADKVRQP